ncbi:MAG: hypothetical protein AB7F64_10005 [Gammaproteobacteria bacterium]
MDALVINKFVSLLKNIVDKEGDVTIEVDHYIFSYRKNKEIDEISNQQIAEVFAELAYYLDYYVFDEKKRSEDRSFYGNEKLKQEVNDALVKIEKLRIKEL